jgi:hypothetical protein
MKELVAGNEDRRQRLAVAVLLGVTLPVAGPSY